MKSFFLKLFVNALALMAVAHLVAGIQLDKWQTTIIAALVLGLLNAFLRPILIFLTLPLNILSLGIFTLFINGFTFYLVSKFVKGFNIVDFRSAFWGALLFSIISFILNILIKPTGQSHVKFHSYHMPQKKKFNDAIDVDAHIDDDEK